ncbi:hypothetical protein PHPALM_28235 [Phytophthora palmivora]|uniref:Uncharacterized protein n=1 Tax=Phytophthora palmivora TaxID=4796 RepID=A0A2P4XAK8_9STRA|nr:hypothetical protein PHPALM_28235 [Phytophthora palmivora]
MVALTEQPCLARRRDNVLLDAWRGLAKKQKRLRRDAESENQELRSLYIRQMKTIKTLKRLFQKQIDAKSSACMARNFISAAFYETERDAVTVLEQLSSSLGTVFGETDRVFRLNGLNVVTSPFSKTITQPVSAASTHIELLKCDVLPLDFRAVAKAFYGMMTAGCGLDETENANETGARKQSVVARAFTVEVEERVKIQYRYAGIRYSEHKREVIVLAAQNKLLEVFGIALDDVGFHEKSWCVMSEVAPGLCLLQLCIGLTVEVKNVVPGRQQFVNRICEMLAHMKREIFDSVQRDVEHELLVC